MFRRCAVVMAATALAAGSVWGQMPGMHRQGSDTMPGMGMMDHQMMMGGMMGQGMMGSGMMQMMGQGMGMMATGGPGPAAILRASDALALSDEQTGRLEAIQTELSGTQQTHMERAAAAHARAQQALQGDSPDFSTYESALKEAAEEMVQAHVAMARAAAQAREVLTEAQREQLGEGMGMMRGMMMGGEGMKEGMMPRQPGMGGGMPGHHQ